MVVALSDCRSQGCRDWVRAGRPYAQSKPTAAFKVVIQGHGFTVYGYPDDSHLKAPKPEDHTPFSATGWPIPAPRWIGNALDIMPRGDTEAALKELADLARQIIADKNAGVPGTEWIKYLNWTDEDGNCWHVSWQTGVMVVTRSTDKWHIHISGRSDKVNEVPPAWDPVGRMHGTTGQEDDDMGATVMGVDIPRYDPDGPKHQVYNIGTGLVAAGAADDRLAWAGICNDTLGEDYALRLYTTTGNGGFSEFKLDGDPKGVRYLGEGVHIIKSGYRASALIPEGTADMSIARMAIDGDGKAVWPTPTLLPFGGHLGMSIERGPVQK